MGRSHVIMLYNAEAGTRRFDIGELVTILDAAGVHAIVQGVEPRRLTESAATAIQAGASVIIAAGGDGTVGAVASAVAESPATLGVLPVGTLNHFARDLGIPMDVTAAAKVIALERTRAIDVGRVNGHTFVNNCSIGLYPHIVRRRDGQRHRLGRGRWFAMALAAISVFRRYPLVDVAVDVNGATLHCKSPLVFVGNNLYETNLLNLGRRRALDRHELSIYLANAPSRWRFLRMMLRGLVGRLHQERDFQTMVATSLSINTRKKRLRVAIDGEVVRMKPPLVFSVSPGGLRVLAP
jgi:diacylglycerol kinase family enzyme